MPRTAGHGTVVRTKAKDEPELNRLFSHRPIPEYPLLFSMSPDNHAHGSSSNQFSCFKI